MDDNGFTLIELIGVLVILVVLSLLISPVVVNFIKDNESDIEKHNISMVEIAAQNMMTDEEYIDLLPDKNEKCYIQVSEIRNNGYLDYDFTDFDAGYIIIVSKEHGYSYEYDNSRGSISKCTR